MLIHFQSGHTALSVTGPAPKAIEPLDLTCELVQ